MVVVASTDRNPNSPGWTRPEAVLSSSYDVNDWRGRDAYARGEERTVLFDSDRTGLGQAYAAEVPGGLLASLDDDADHRN